MRNSALASVESSSSIRSSTMAPRRPSGRRRLRRAVLREDDPPRPRAPGAARRGRVRILDDRRAGPSSSRMTARRTCGPTPLQIDEGIDRLGLAADALDAERNVEAGLPEDLARARGRRVAAQRRIGGVERQVERHRETLLGRRRLAHRQVRPGRVEDGGANAGEQARTLQDLRGERSRRRVVDAEELDVGAQVARGRPPQQLEVVLEDHRGDRARGHVDHPRTRVPQADQQEQEPLFLVVGAPLRGSTLREGTTTDV